MKKKYHIGYALSGGGAKGFAHAGALKALEEYGIKPDVIAGTSAGSVVAALYSAGKTPDEIKTIFLHKKGTDFTSLTIPKSGFLNPERFMEFLDGHIEYQNIEHLPIPIYICATNFEKGEEVVFTSGELVPRIMASCCVPVVFNLINIDGVHYADGGIFRNLPATPIRELCDILIGINVGPSIPEFRESVVFVAQQSYDYMFRANMLEDKSLCDLLVETHDVSQYGTFEIDKVEEIFNLGYEKMKKALFESPIVDTVVLQ